MEIAQGTYLKVNIIEPVILGTLEEVRHSIVPSESSINAAWHSDPVLYWLGILLRDGWLALAVKSPVFGS